MTTTETVHMSQSITGPLMNWRIPDWKRATKWITRKDGTSYTWQELKQVFIDELAKGHECVPIGDCDNFDFKKGCLGHPGPQGVSTDHPGHENAP